MSNYNNRLPEISRIDQSVRDIEFISISELKTFDDKLQEIIEKFSSVNSSTGSQAMNLGQLMKQIEYNMADAINFTESGEIDSLRDTIDSSSGAIVPDYGENSYENLITKLNDYYNQFMALFGNDEEVDNWKNELSQYKDAAISAFRDRIQGIFGRVAEQNAIESKEDHKKDYITSDPVKIKMNQIMRLNPDKHAFVRQIAVLPSGPNQDTIAFEVGELESNTLALNIKLQNKDLYYSFNVIVDKKEAFILKEEHIKLANYNVTIKIDRYVDDTGKTMYVFSMNTTNPDTSVSYAFELTGILINGYNFGSSGQKPTDHGYYYSYHEVDPNSKPDYDKIYYVKVKDESATNIKTNYVVYNRVNEIEPNYNKTYWTPIYLDNGTVRYKEQKYLTAFDPELIYFTRVEEFISDNEAVENDYVMQEFTHLHVFDTNKQYFTKDIEWVRVKEFDLSDDLTDGIVDALNKDVTGEKVFENNEQTLVEGVKYKDKLKYKNVDIDCAELFGSTINSEKAARTKQLCRLDDGVRFYKPFNGMINKVRRGAKKINGNLAISIGSKIADLVVIQPNGCAFSTPLVDKTDVVAKTNIELLEEYGFELNTSEITTYDIQVDEFNFFELLKNTNTGRYIDSFGQTLQDHIMFVESFHVEFIGCIGSLLDFQICCDGSEDYDKCCHLYYNTKTNEEVILPVLRNTIDSISNTIVMTEKNWISTASDGNFIICVAEDGEVIYSEDGRIWKKNYKASELGLKKIYHTEENWIGFTADNKILDSMDGFFISSEIEFDYQDLDVNTLDFEKIKFKIYNKNLWVLAVKSETDDGVKTEIFKCENYKKFVYAYTLDYDFDSFIFGDYFTYPEYTERFEAVGTFSYASKSGDTFKIGFDKEIIEEEIDFGDLDADIYDIINQASIKIDALIVHESDILTMYSFLDDDGNINIKPFYFTITGKDEYVKRTFSSTFPIISVSDTTERIMQVVDGTDGVLNTSNNLADYLGYVYVVPTNDSGAYIIQLRESSGCTVESVSGVDPDYIEFFRTGEGDEFKMFLIGRDKVGIGDVSGSFAFIDMDSPIDFEKNQYNQERVAFIGGEHHALNTWVFAGTSNVFYVDANSNAFTSVLRKVNNSLLNIKDIQERENDILVADSFSGSLQYDPKSGLYTDNVIDKQDYFQYASTSIGVFAFGAGKGDSYLVNWLNGRTKTFAGVELDSVLECGTDNTIYCFPTNANGLYKYDKVSGLIEPTNVFPEIEIGGVIHEQLSNVKCEYGFETSDGLFIVGSMNIGGHQKEVIYFSRNRFAENTFTEGGHEDTESQRIFERILVVDKIDYCQPYDDEIIISTYDENNPSVKYTFDRTTLSFRNITVTDTNHVYSFNSAETFNGKIYVLNGTGSNPNVRKGFGELVPIRYDADSNIAEDNGFFDITILKDISDIEVMNSPSLFVHGGMLFGILLKVVDDGEGNEETTFEVYFYMQEYNTFIKVTREISPLITAIINVANAEIADVKEADPTVGCSIAIQETANKNVETIRNYKFDYADPNYQFDKYYFDKVNDGIILGNYVNGNNYFRIESNCIAMGRTLLSHRTQIAIALSKENYIALYDKKLASLKTVPLRYKGSVNGTSHYVNVDDRFVIKGLFMGSSLNDNDLYILLNGKFPNLVLNGTRVEETQVAEATHKLFKFPIREIIDEEMSIASLTQISITLDDPDTVITDVREYIQLQNQIVSENLDLDVRNNLQYIGCGRSMLYDNVDSIAFWNTNSGSLDIVSPLNWNDDILDIDISGTKEAETYRDYKVFVESPNGINGTPKFFTYNGERNIKTEIEVDYAEAMKVRKYNPVNGTYTEGSTVPMSFCRVGKTVFADGGQLPIVTDIVVNKNKTGALTSFKISKNTSLNLPDDLDITSMRPTYDGALAFVNKHRTTGVGDSILPEDRDDMYYRIKSDGKSVSRDMFSIFGKRYYNKALQTRFGLFRWDERAYEKLSDVQIGDSRYDYVGNIFFNTKGVAKTIIINPGMGNVVTEIFESLEGIFFSVQSSYKVGNVYLRYFKFYRMVNVPIDDSHIIYLDDENYFETVDCGKCKVIDIADTQFGTFLISNSDGMGNIMRWNGSTFYKVSNLRPYAMYDTSEGLLFYVEDSDDTYMWDDKNKNVILDTNYNPHSVSRINSVSNSGNWFGHPKHYFETEYGPVIGGEGGFYNYNTKQMVPITADHVAIANYFTIRKYDKDLGFRSRNLYKLANHLHDHYDLPCDINMKCFGSVLYNGLQVPVSGIRIISKPGQDYEPLTVRFTIDKDARFTRNKDTINALFANKSGDGYLFNMNVGEIADYNEELEKYYDHIINISKVNIVVLSDKLADPRETEFGEKYEEILGEIQTMKQEVIDLMNARNDEAEQADMEFSALERRIDGFDSTETIDGLRNIAENLGFEVNSAGCAIVDGDPIEGFKQLVVVIREKLEEGDYTGTYIGDYLVIPKVSYLERVDDDTTQPVEYENLRFDVVGINTYCDVGPKYEDDPYYKQGLENFKLWVEKGYIVVNNDGIVQAVANGNKSYLIGPLSIPEDTVKGFVNNAFDSCTNIDKVYLSKSLKKITTVRTFQSCTGIRNLVIPEGVEELGEYCFYNCTNLFRVKIPKSMVKMDKAFYSDGNIQYAEFGNVYGWKAGTAIIDCIDPANAAVLLRSTYPTQIWTYDETVVPTTAIELPNKDELIDVRTLDTPKKGLLLQCHDILADGHITYHQAIEANEIMANALENDYDFKMKYVKRFLGINPYTVPADLNKMRLTMSKVCGNYGATNNCWWAQKVFFQAEQEIGQPMQSNCSFNTHTSNVWPLYNKAPQTRVKYIHGRDKFDEDNNPIDTRGNWWTDTIAVTGTPTNGANIPYGQMIFASNDGLCLRSNGKPSTNTDITTNWTLSRNEVGAVPCFYL